MEYLVAVDLEGVNGVVGEPYKGLSPDMADYQVAIKNATKEINQVAKALFESGAKKVVVWDCHGGGKNLDFSLIDSRVTPWQTLTKRRMDFCKNFNFSAILFVGYHSKAGSFNGVLAHTFNSTNIQYIKINGKAVGEYEIDSYIAGKYGIKPIFASSDDIALKEILNLDENVVTVKTKIAKGRNKADLIDDGVVLKNIYEGVKASVKANTKVQTISMPIAVEIRYTRTEKAEEFFNKAKELKIAANYKEDAHTIEYSANNIEEIALMV